MARLAAVHTHFEVRTDPKQEHEFTTQLYYDEALMDQIHAQKAYAQKGQRLIRNDDCRVFQDGGDELLLQLAEDKEATRELSISRLSRLIKVTEPPRPSWWSGCLCSSDSGYTRVAGS